MENKIKKVACGRLFDASNPDQIIMIDIFQCKSHDFIRNASRTQVRRGLQERHRDNSWVVKAQL